MPTSQILLPLGVALFYGLLCSGAMATHLLVFRPRLRAFGARNRTLAITDLLTAAIPVSLALIALAPDVQAAEFLLDVGSLGWLAVGINPRLVIRLTGGQSLAHPNARLLWDADSAWLAVTSGDPKKAAAIAASLSPGTTDEGHEYVRTWQEYVAQAGQIPLDNERASGLARRLRELERRLDGQSITSRTPLVAALLAATLLGGIPLGVDSAMKGEPCAGVEWLLLSGRIFRSSDSADQLLEATVFHAPGTLLEDRQMGFDDINAYFGYAGTGEVLARNAYQTGYRRVTQLADGAQIQFGVYEFWDTDGAHAFQAWINRNACQFSNETFPAPGGGLGLQLRRQNPAFPIVEQVSWVSGNRRYVLSHSFSERPLDHATILSLGRRAVAVSGAEP